MNEKKTIRVVRQTLEEYKQQEPQRLGEEDLNEGGLYQLMMRTQNLEAAALSAPVFLRGIQSQLARLSFGVIYTDGDLRPVTSKPHESTLIDRYWTPNRPLPLRIGGREGVVRTGYFTPYESELDDELRQMSESLSTVGSARL